MSRSGSATARRISGSVASAFAWPPFDSKKMVVATFWWRRAFVIVSTASLSRRSGVRVLLAADVRRDRALELCAAELLEDRRSEEWVVERRRSHADERVLVRALEARLIGIRHPEGEQAQYAAGLLESGQRLPLPLEHRQQRRVERIGSGESVLRVVDGEPVRDLGPMGLDPVGVFGGGLLRVVRQASPLEQPPPDDLRRLRLRPT